MRTHHDLDVWKNAIQFVTLIYKSTESFPKSEVYASNTLTAVKVPENINCSELLNILENKQQVIISTGQGKLSGKILRIGHLGIVSDEEINWLINSILETMKSLNNG